MKLFDSTFSAINKALDLRFKRHSTLASNMANASTPNYRAREVNFAGELERVLHGNAGELKKTDPKHMDLASHGQSFVTYDTTGAIGADGNNVDLDITMGKLSTNSRAYSNAATLLSMKLRMLRAASRMRGGS